MSRAPVISIGVPAYNAGTHIRAALESLLAQTWADFELIISDNASTDGTRDIVEEYRRRDRRIRYERQSLNLGANANYSWVARRATGEFFKWSSSSDWCAPTFLECCVRALHAYPDAVLAVPRTRLFQRVPEMSCEYEGDIEVLEESPSARFRNVMSNLALNNAISGLIRTQALRTTSLIQPYRGADVILMGHLALLGKFRLLNDALYFRRMEPSSSTVLQSDTEVWVHHYPYPSARMLMQNSRWHLGALRAVLTTPMSLAEHLRSLAFMARMCRWDRRFLADDLRQLWRYVSHSTLPGGSG